MSNIFFTKIKPDHQVRLQAYVLLGLGLLCMLGALVLHPNPFAFPVGLLFFGLGTLISAVVNPARLTIAGIIYTLLGAVIFDAFKPIIPYDSGLAVIAAGLAVLTIAILTRRGYIGTGAVSPAILILIVGLLLYQPTGRAASRALAPFILSLWFPGIMFFLIGLFYYIQYIRNVREAKRANTVEASAE